MSDHDADAARIRAREILARTAPTPEDIAEHEARRKANRIAAIMARTVPSRVIYKVKETALLSGAAAGSAQAEGSTLTVAASAVGGSATADG